jgi:hypothetical protein
MRRMTLALAGLLLAAFVGACVSSVASSPSPSTQHSQSPAPAGIAPSPFHCNGGGGSAPQNSGWLTYSSTEWCYSVDYPASWYSLNNHGAPVTETYFSSENVDGGPETMTTAGVYLVISVISGACPPASPYYRVDGEQMLNVAGETVSRTYGYQSSPTGFWLIRAVVTRGPNCQTFNYVAYSQTARDRYLVTADRMITSVRFT